MLILTHRDVRQVLDGAELAVMSAVRTAYLSHEEGRSALPHSVFLRFPEDDRSRIIALPAYLQAAQPVVGIKWISSYPANLARGLARASAVIILNSPHTGRAEALIEGSTISARRTAASAALAARTLVGTRPDAGVSLIGCGVINYEVLTFLLTDRRELAAVTLFDLDRGRAQDFADRCMARWPEVKFEIAEQIEDAMAAHRLISLATTATIPHLDGSHCQPETLVLHLSLRDLMPMTILSSTNVVDDLDHVCRAATSIHLAEQEVGHRDFVTGSLGAVLGGGVDDGTGVDGHFRRPEDGLTVFSPFGLGILDLAVADLVREGAERLGLGTHVPDFLPEN